MHGRKAAHEPFLAGHGAIGLAASVAIAVLPGGRNRAWVRAGYWTAFGLNVADNNGSIGAHPFH